MPLLLSAIPWRLVAIIGIVAGLFFGAMWVTSQIKKVGALEAEKAQLTQDLKSTVALADKYKSDLKTMQAIVAEGAKKKSGISRDADKRKRKIIDALPSDDGVLADVLRRTLDGLPNPTDKDGGSPKADHSS